MEKNFMFDYILQSMCVTLHKDAHGYVSSEWEILHAKL